MTSNIFLSILAITLFSCTNPSKDKQITTITSPSVDTTSNEYLKTLKIREQIAANNQSDDLGELINTISINVVTDNKKDFDNGVRSWVSIENTNNDLAKLVDGDEIVIKENKITIIIDYPLTNEYKFDLLSQTGFSRKQLIKEIRKNYYKLYDEEEKSATIKTIPINKRTTMYNRNQTNGKYGIWGHDIADLVLAEILVYKTPGGQIVLSLNIES